jgi:CDP-diglyceride synthetase
MISIPLLANIGSLLLLVLYIYTIAGMILFGRVKRNYFVKDNLNFESFPKGVFTLLVICTCDWWSDIVASFMKKKSPDFYCLDDPTYYDYVENGY